MSIPVAAVSYERVGAAAGAITAYAAMISLADNFVREISETSGLWQFQMLRAVMGLAILAGLAALPFVSLRARNWRAVLTRGAVQAVGIMFYYGSLAFLSVAEACAGFYTAPIFVLLLGRVLYGHRLGGVRIAAVLVGFAGTLMVLSPDLGSLGWVTFAPVIAGAFYALANIATREWCEGESAHVLTAGYLVMLGICGAVGMIVMTLAAPVVPEGPEGFLLRGAVWPEPRVWLWTLVQAVATVVGVSLMVRAYQLADAARVSVMEYVILPFSAFWAWVLFGQTITMTATMGIILIIAAGVVMARGR